MHDRRMEILFKKCSTNMNCVIVINCLRCLGTQYNFVKEEGPKYENSYMGHLKMYEILN